MKSFLTFELHEFGQSHWVGGICVLNPVQHLVEHLLLLSFNLGVPDARVDARAFCSNFTSPPTTLWTGPRKTNTGLPAVQWR